MAKTVREISENLGISKQAVQQRMNDIDGFRDKYTRKVGNRLEIDDKGVRLLTGESGKQRQEDQQEQQKQQAKNDKKADRLEDALLKQLETKDEQIAQLQKALDQQQQLQLTTVQENRKLKDQIQDLGGYIGNDNNDNQNDKDVDKTPLKQDSESVKAASNQQASPKAKKGFWKRVFNK